MIAVAQTAVVTSLYGDYVYVVRLGGEPRRPDGEPKSSRLAPRSRGRSRNRRPMPRSPRRCAARQTRGTSRLPAPAMAAGAEQNPAARGAPGVRQARPPRRPGRDPGRSRAGDVVVTAGQNRLYSGMSVAIDNTIDPTSREPEDRPEMSFSDIFIRRPVLSTGLACMILLSGFPGHLQPFDPAVSEGRRNRHHDDDRLSRRQRRPDPGLHFRADRARRRARPKTSTMSRRPAGLRRAP